MSGATKTRRANRIQGTRAHTAVRPKYKPGRALLRWYQVHCVALWPLSVCIGVYIPVKLHVGALPGTLPLGLTIQCVFLARMAPGLVVRRRVLSNIAALDRSGTRLEEIAAYRSLLNVYVNGKPANEAAKRTRMAKDAFICKELGVLDVRGQMPMRWRLTEGLQGIFWLGGLGSAIWFVSAHDQAGSMTGPALLAIHVVVFFIARGLIRAHLAGEIQDRLEFGAARSPLVAGWASELGHRVHPRP